MERRLAAMVKEAEEGEENAKVAARYEVTKRNQEDIERMLKKIASLEQDLQLRDESISDLSRQLKQANSQLQSQSLLHKPGTSMKTSSQDFAAQNYDMIPERLNPSQSASARSVQDTGAETELRIKCDYLEHLNETLREKVDTLQSQLEFTAVQKQNLANVQESALKSEEWEAK